MWLKNVTSKDKLGCCYTWYLGHDRIVSQMVIGTRFCTLVGRFNSYLAPSNHQVQ